MRNVVVLTPWFPNRPGDAGGAFVADSALAVMRSGWNVGVLVVRPWRPRLLQRFAGAMMRGSIDAAAHPFAALATARTPDVPGVRLRRATDVAADRIVADALERMVRATGADIIHVHTEGLAPIGTRTARRLRLPCVVTVHGINTHPRFLHGRYQAQRLAPALAAADRVVLVGEPLRGFFRDYVGSDERFTVVPNGVDMPPEMARGPYRAAGPVRLISVGNLQDGKGIDITLLALARLAAQGIADWTYDVIGEGPQQKSLLRMTRRSGLVDKVTFLGPVRHAAINEYLAGHDVFVLPSCPEAFGIAHLEAMAAGLLTIGVRGQGPSHFIEDGVTGLLVPPRDPGALAAILQSILRGDRRPWQTIAGNGRRAVQGGFLWEHHARRLTAVYRQAITAQPRAARDVAPAAAACGDKSWRPAHRLARGGGGPLR